MASSFVWRSANHPQADSAAMSSNMANGLRALNPINRPMKLLRCPSVGMVTSPVLGGGADPALGGDQKVSRGHYPLALPEPVENLEGLAAALAELDLARLQPALTEVDEDQPPRAGVDDRRGGDLQ